MRTLIPIFLFLGASISVLAQSDTYEVIWTADPYYSHPSISAPSQVGELIFQSATIDVTSWLVAHLNGEITLYEDWEKETPLPREITALTSKMQQLCYSFAENDLLEPESFSNEAFEEEFSDYDYLQENLGWSIANVLIKETWKVKDGVTRSNQALLLEVAPDEGNATSYPFLIGTPLAELPAQLLHFGSLNLGYIAEESLSEAIDRQRVYTQVLSLKPEGEPNFMDIWVSTTRPANEVSDSLLQAWGYTASLPSATQVDDWYPVQTKPDVTLRLESPFPTEFPAKRGRQKKAEIILEGLVPKILEGIKSGELQPYEPERKPEKILAETVMLRMEEIASEEWGTEFDEENTFEKGDESDADNLLSYQSVLQIQGEMIRQNKTVSFVPKWVAIVWKDPSENLPERAICMVPVEDLDQKPYLVKGKTVKEWFTKYQKINYYPIEIMTGLRTYQEAWLFKYLLEKGRWNDFPTFDDRDGKEWQAYLETMPSKYVIPSE